MFTTYKFMKPDPRLEELAIERGSLNYVAFDKTSQAVIKRCCKIQIETFKEVATIDTLIEIRNEGFDISLEELQKDSASQIRNYNKVLQCPNKLLMLDDINLSLFKHHLFNEYYDTPSEDDAAPIWAAMNFLEDVDICLN